MIAVEDLVLEEAPVESTLGNWNRRREPRIGVMAHYDASLSDAGAARFLTSDPSCNVSYNRLVLDAGRAVKITPDDARAWHAGRCRPSEPRLAYRDANSAFYGFAVAATAGDTITAVQRDVLVALCVWAFQRERWSLAETWRITDHAAEAWPRGRKVDLGTQLVGLSVAIVRAAVAAYPRTAAPTLPSSHT